MILIPQVPLGESVPPNTKYAVSVSLPTWEDNVDYEKGDPRVVNCMVSGYPRFFIAMPIQALVANVKDRFALPNETAMLFPSQACADRCVQFIYDQAPKQQGANSYALPRQGQVRVVQHVVEPINKQAAALDTMGSVLKSAVTIYCVLFPEDLFPLAKQYWQHTGDGISARLADYCLNIARINEEYESATSPYTAVNGASVARRGSKSGYSRGSVAQGLPSVDAALEADTYLEERFGRNFDLKYAAEMKEALRRRIADAMGEHSRADGADAGASKAARLSSDDVYIVATGMSAVFHSHQALLKVRQGKSICFGFPYTDTLKILQKFGPGAYFLGHGEGDDYLELEQILERHHQENDPILAIFTECPSNPLLKTADLPRLRALANRYNAALVVDETLGSIANVDALSWADAVVSSLTKVFSGDSNVMAGSIVLNPGQPFYGSLKTSFGALYEDLLWCEDAIFLERNSRDFMYRVSRINDNALAVVELLRASDKVDQVNYPKYTTPECYARIQRSGPDAGFGGLLSVVFHGGEEASKAFYNHLLCCKGPSLGTNFTLASPYTILAHFTELEWAAQYGVRADLVRVSVGLEPRPQLLAMFQSALDAIPAPASQ